MMVCLSFPAPAAQVSTEAAPANPQTRTAAEKTPEGRAAKKADTRLPSGARKRRQRTAPPPDGAPRKIVVREGGAKEPAAQIAPDITPAEAARQRENTEELLGATGDQLKMLAGRSLDAQQQETVGQICNYMDGAHSALQEGDVRRASTLAQKADLLADDLAKHLGLREKE